MANIKKNQMAQILFPMVDKTDFATIESGITESDFNSAATKKFFGVNHGVSDAFTSGTISKTGRLVRSGIFQVTLKASETNYDHLLIRITHPSCADQVLTYETVDNDDSDLMSALTLIRSDASDAASAAQQANSRILLVQSRLSDFDSRVASDFSDIISRLSDIGSDLRSYLVGLSGSVSDLQSAVSDAHSDLKSAIGAIVVDFDASDVSDVASAVWANSIGTRVDSRINVILSDSSDLRSALSSLESEFLSRVPKLVATNSQVSDLASDLRSVLIVNQSAVSDLYSLLSDHDSNMQSRVPKRVATDSQLSDVHSDLASKIAGITASVSASDISDIASAVRATLVSDLSDIHSAATAAASRALLNQSRVSDIYSLLSDHDSNMQSRVPKEVAARSQLSDLASDLKSAIANVSVTLTASDISDIASAVAAAAGTLSASEISDIASAVRAILVSDLSDIYSAATQTNSRVLINQSRVSDIYSLASDLQSDFQSRVPKRVATDSQLSDLHSDLRSHFVLDHSTLSDIYSQVSNITSILANPAGYKKNTSALLKFILINSTDHISPITGRTVTATRSIDGGAFAACTNAVTEIANGAYQITLSTTDLNGDFIMFRFAATGADDRFIGIKTEP